MKVLVTGSAGFIGYHTTKKLLQEGFNVIGIDNINDYYSTDLKFARLADLGIEENKVKWFQRVVSHKLENFEFIRISLEDKLQIFDLFRKEKFDFVVNLAAQAGVRYSLENPDVYINSNIVGFHNILEACRSYNVQHLLHASSSSVYGENGKTPFSEEDSVDSPVSLYAATKKSNELFAHAYSHLYKIPITCLRFFTVYGPWGRPDMAPMLFAKSIAKGEAINVFNEGRMERDFTFIDDIVKSMLAVMTSKFDQETKFRVLNIGNGTPVNLMEFISEMEKGLGIAAKKNMLPMQPGDVPRTWASQERLFELTGVKPSITLEQGVKRFVEWYRSYFTM